MEKSEFTINPGEIKNLLLILDEYALLAEEKNLDLCPRYVNSGIMEEVILKLLKELEENEGSIDLDIDFPGLKNYFFIRHAFCA